jgi:5-methylcytosine-specific restriction endonuclease McrA
MTERDSFRISETKKAVFERDGYQCRNCGLSIYRHGTPQCAHRLASSESNKKKYGESVIHHIENLASTCSLFCNGKMNIGFKTVEAEALAEHISNVMQGER